MNDCQPFFLPWIFRLPFFQISWQVWNAEKTKASGGYPRWQNCSMPTFERGNPPPHGNLSWGEVMYIAFTSWRISSAYSGGCSQIIGNPYLPLPTAQDPQNHGTSECLALSNARLNGFWVIWTAIFLFILILTPPYISLSSFFLTKWPPNQVKINQKSLTHGT